MKNLIVTSSNGAVTMSSIDLLDMINSVRAENGESEIRRNKFSEKIEDELAGDHYTKSAVKNPNGTESVIYDLTMDQCALLSMRESRSVRRKVLAKLKELESRQQVAIPQTYAEALLEAGRLAKIAEEQAAQLAIAAPKVEFVDRYVESAGNKGFREVCKLLKAKEPEFRQFLADNKIMYRLGGSWTAYQQHIDAGRFAVNTGAADNGHAYTAAKFTPKGINWIAGEWAKHQLEVAV